MLTMKKVLFSLVILLLTISCDKNEKISKQVPELDSIKNDKPYTHNYYIVDFPDSNLVLQYRILPFGNEEAEIGAKINDKVNHIYFHKWDTVSQNKIILDFASTNAPDNKKIINDYKTLKINYEIAKKKFYDDEISKQELENIETQLIINKKKFEALTFKTSVVAPFNGVISDVFVKKGQSVTIGQVLLKISKIDTIKAKISISEEDYKLISKEIFPEIIIGNKNIKGKFGKFFKANKNDSYYINEITFLNDKKEINIKDSLAIFIDTKTKNNRIFLPVSAVRIEQDTYVQMLTESGTIEKRIISVGNMRNDSIEVISGLKKGDKIIL